MNNFTSLRETIRNDLEATRREYHHLLSTLTDDDWHQLSANPTMTVGQLMSHLAEDVGFMTRLVACARKGRSINPPEWLFYLLNPFRVRWGARRAGRHTVGTTYDQGHSAMCALLDTILDADWDKGAIFLGRYTTVEGVFRLPVKHLAQHAADINKGLGRV